MQEWHVVFQTEQRRTAFWKERRTSLLGRRGERNETCDSEKVIAAWGGQKETNDTQKVEWKFQDWRDN